MKFKIICLVSALAIPVSPASANLSRDTALRASKVCKEIADVRYVDRENILCVNGEIDIDGLLRSNIEKIRLRKHVYVVFKSPGGGMIEAIKITEFLEKFQYNVVVDGVCASACAQFIFMGANSKFVVGDGIVAMHGGPIPSDQIDRLVLPISGKSNLKAEQDIFRKFYSDRNISIKITQNAPEQIRKRIENGEIIFWAPKRNEFLAFGVGRVYFINARVMKN